MVTPASVGTVTFLCSGKSVKKRKKHLQKNKNGCQNFAFFAVD